MPGVERLSIGDAMEMGTTLRTTTVVLGIVIQPNGPQIWKGRARQ